MENLPFDYRSVYRAMNRNRVACQLALPRIYQKLERIQTLRELLDNDR
jgi:hypothetical protein